ncbi:MFS transporter [Rhodococcus sp. IEGM 1307]|uniref:MFS transporter n=1 Tax=Rhodococcus sp. IEGM 1307 TaxID=3047091 RepID=UPI0024B6D89C|nr:MFS transporter [Rhodococcus sp. IEGM 1307]MDI9975769.1 MFS transporter [Rhodococcus sp. IEGM 1307]
MTITNTDSVGEYEDGPVGTKADPGPVDKKRFLVKLTGVIAGGMFIDGYILGIVGTVIGAITLDLDMSLYWEGLIGASALIGIFVGGPLGGWLADKLGRKPLFAIDLAIFILGSVMQFFVDSAWQLFAVRLLMGIAIGADYSVGWPLLSEFAPRRLRGKLLAYCEVAWYVGFMFAFVSGFLMTTVWSLDWRIVLGSSTVPAVILFLARLGMPESPRWLMNKGRTEDATEIAHAYLEDPSDVVDIANEGTRKGTFGMLFSPAYRRATIFISIFWFCAVAPYFAIATFAASVLEGYGLGDGLVGAIGVNGLALVGVMVSVLLIERVGRRKLTIPQQWVCAVVLLIIGLWTSAPPAVVLICFLVFAFANAMSTALTGVYPGEIFPTEIRGLGTGFATAFSRVGAGLGTFLLPWSMHNLGAGITMLIAAGICVVGAAVSQVLAPETMGRNLSETSAPRVGQPART